MQRSIFLVALAVPVLIVGALLSPPPQLADAASGKQVWVYYMGFWGGGPSWDAQVDTLTDHPLIGHYDSRDPGVAGTQIDQAMGAGIDAFLVSWFGLADGAQTTAVLNNLLDRAAERGFHVAAVVDVFNPAFNRDRAGLVRSLNYLVYDRANHPGYLRYDGRPVIFFAFQSSAGFSTAEWQSIRNEVDPNHATLWIAEGLSGCCLYGGAMDGMYAFNLAWANGSSTRFASERNAVTSRGGMYIPTVHPGWDEDRIAAKEGRPNPTSRRDRAGGQFLRNSWNGAVTAGTNVILIVSWNEFLENSHIEPSQVYGTQSLDVLRPLIAAWKGGGSSAPPAAPPTSGGQALEATTGLNVRSGPGTTYAIIGRIAPGATYAITGQQGGWYAISYGGRTGWVSGAYVRLTGGAPTGGGPAPAPPASPTGQTLQATTTVNVRGGPGTTYAIIGRITPGATYAITGQQGNWYAIDYGGRTGYVYAPLVRVSAAPPPLPGGATISFVASPSAIRAGQCATLRWDVEGVQAIYFMGQGVTGHETRQVCPSTTTTYTLDVTLSDGSAVRRQVTVTVTG